MLTQTCRIVCDQQVSSNAFKVTPFEVRYSNLVASNILDCIHWQPVETERFQLVASETVKVGQPVNRADADYWIEQAKARALGVGEVIGRVAVR